MGGDFAPDAIVQGARLACEDGLSVLLVGDERRLKPLVGDAAIRIVHTPTALGMDAGASEVRRHDDASVRLAMRLVSAGEATSVVSCGSSAATLVSAVIELGTLDGVDRPAIVIELPRSDGDLVLLDAGASADCKPRHLETFALLGTAWARAKGVDAPKVGLLSNGEERGKGNRLVREAYALLDAAAIDFIGNVEPDDALAGKADVLVCDGYTGNVVLKAAEGLVASLQERLRTAIRGSWRARLGAWLLAPALRDVRDQLDWRHQGGALLLGAAAPVVVGHGRADADATRAAIAQAHYASREGAVRELARALSDRSRAHGGSLDDARRDR